MAKAISALDWCIVRLGDDHNWWVAETSDPVRWDVDGKDWEGSLYCRSIPCCSG